MKVITPEVEDEMVTMARAGSTPRAICCRYGVGRTSVIGVMRRRGQGFTENPPLTEANYIDMMEALNEDDAPVTLLAQSRGMYPRQVMEIALGECTAMPPRWWGRDDLSEDPNGICAIAVGDAFKPITKCSTVQHAIKCGRIFTDITGRIPPQNTSPHPCGFTDVYREFIVDVGAQRRALDRCREMELAGHAPDIEGVYAVSSSFDVPYASIWELCVQLGRNPDYSTSTIPIDMVDAGFDNLDRGTVGLLEGFARQTNERPNFCRTVREMYDDGSFGWVSPLMPQPCILERVVIPGFHKRAFEVDEDGNVFSVGSEIPRSVRLNESGHVEVRVRGSWMRLDRLVCTAFHGVPEKDYAVHHFTGKRDCRPISIEWKNTKKLRSFED